MLKRTKKFVLQIKRSLAMKLAGNTTVLSNSLYISRTVSHFCETESEIWAGFGPIGNSTENV
jgi:hypothetical protein